MHNYATKLEQLSEFNPDTFIQNSQPRDLHQMMQVIADVLPCPNLNHYLLVTLNNSLDKYQEVREKWREMEERE